MKTIAASILAMTLAACSAAASGSADDDNGGGGSGDGQGQNTPGKDGGSGNTGDAANAPPPGTLLLEGNPSPTATTTDGKVVYVDGAPGQSQSFAVVDVASKKTTVLAKDIQPTDVIIVQGKVVAFWTGVDKTSGIGAFHLYTGATGTKDGDAKSLAGLFAASDDGSRVVYSSAATSGTTGTTTLTLAAADLSGANPVVTNAGFGTAQAPCYPRIGFVGTRLFAATCAGQATSATLITVDAAGTAVTVAVNALPFWDADKAGDKVLAISSAGGARIHTIPGNTVTTIDTGVSFGVLSADGQSVLYRAGTALKRSPTGTPQPQTLVAQGVRGLLGVSDDLAWVMAFSNAPDTQNQVFVRSDIQLAAGATPGALSTLLAASTGMMVGFTSTHAVYMTDLPTQGLIGALRAKPLAGGAEVDLAKDGLFPQVLPSDNRVLYQAGFKSVDQNNSVGDVQIADLASGKTTTVVAGVDPGFVSDGTNVYFTVGAKALYSIAIP